MGKISGIGQSGLVNQITRFYPALVFLGSAISCLLLVLSFSSISLASPQTPADGSVIAYVSSSTENQEIRTINPDGTGDRLLWAVPQGVAPVDGIGLTQLSWHPDATEIAFDSGHDWERSQGIRDLYSVSPDGTNLRRLTRPPAPSEYANYPTGQVRFTLDAIEQGDVQVYIDGAEEPVRYVSRLHDTWTFTFTLADFGDNFRQYIRLWDPDQAQLQPACNYSEEGWVDVIPGQLTDVGTIHFSAITSHRQCPRMVNPSWSHDGSHLLYLSNWIHGTFNRKNDVWRIAPNAPTSTVGEQILDPDQHSVTDSGVFGAVLNPTAERGEQFLYWGQSGFGSPVYLSNLSDPLPPTGMTGCSVSVCHTRGIAWHPNGREFYWAVYAEDYADNTFEDGGYLYRYDVDSRELTFILNLPGEEIGRLALSPDGETIAFERATLVYDEADYTQWGRRLLCPCEIWTVNSDGTNLQRLVADGHSPAWSSTAPTSPVLPTATPVPGATTQSTPQSTPQPTERPTQQPSAEPTSTEPTSTPVPPGPAGSTPVLTPEIWLPYMETQ